MTRESIKEAVIDIISEILPDEDLSKIALDEPLRDQLELDSMDFLDIVMELRKQYSVEVPEQDYVKLETLDSTVEYLEPLMQNG
ncbi:MAG: acyl carrier protein [Nitrospinota bacterium]